MFEIDKLVIVAKSYSGQGERINNCGEMFGWRYNSGVE